MNRIGRMLDKVFLLRRETEKDWPRWKRAVFWAYRYGLLLCASLCVGWLGLGLAYGDYSEDVFLSYLSSWKLLALNLLPAAVLALLLYGALGRAWASLLASSGVVLGLGLGHYYKLLFRDDPLYFEDLLNLREAGAMTQQGYSLFLDRRVALTLLFAALVVLLLPPLARGRLKGWKPRLSTAAAALLLAAAVTPFYLDDGLYQSLGSFQNLNYRNPTDSYVARGFLYPFLHSAADFFETPPEGYSAAKAEALLSAYKDADIPDGKKINIIAIMREAYADFSRYGVEGLDVSGYELYHSLEAESLTGDLVTNIFAGGTVDTERCFLTGSCQVRSFHRLTNSYVWYFRKQGYTVEGSHPYYQWFYDRRSVNENLGFQRYRYLEDGYEGLSDAVFLPDSFLLPEIWADYQAGKASGAPYFSFSVNIQSHGPYATWDTGAGKYLTGDGYSIECRNAVDRYLTSIFETDEALLELVERLRTDPEPVVLVTFGDHLPWMGDGGAFYEEMGIDLDLDTDEGFRRYYSTRYLIWANDAAREVLGRDLAGEGPEISPCYLMGLLFQELGWEGPAFMQAMDDMMAVFPVVTTNGRQVVDGALVEEIPPQRQELFQDFLYLQQYWRGSFQYG